MDKKHAAAERIMEIFATDRLGDALDNLADTHQQLADVNSSDCPTKEQKLLAAAWIHAAAETLDKAIDALLGRG